MREERNDAWELKDVLVAVSLMATALAICWEIGRFAPFQGFLFFTLSEHLLSAMVGLPFALITVIFLVVAFSFMNRPAHVLARRRNAVRLVIVGMALLIIIAISYPLLTGGNISDIHPLVFILTPMAFVVMIASTLWFFYSTASVPSALVLCGTSLLFAFMMSASISEAQLVQAKQKPEILLSDIVSKSGTIKAYVIMAGERGILFYEPEKDRVTFARIDEIQRIEWKSRSGGRIKSSKED